ncbi:MAG: hypothetical protein JW395_3373 [Nitrospira sp.]|nr:hypothetical protein [Nitrospira sp.]
MSSRTQMERAARSRAPHSESAPERQQIAKEARYEEFVEFMLRCKRARAFQESIRDEWGD